MAIRDVFGPVVVASLALATVACGGSPAAVQESSTEELAASAAEKTYAKFDAMAEGERMDALVSAAESEGELVAYVTSDVVGPRLEAAFEDKYQVDLEILNPGTDSIVRQQVLEQHSAGQLEASVIETYQHSLATIYPGEGVVAEIPNFLAEAVVSPEMATDYGLETFQYPFLVSWNSNQIKGSEVPTSYGDLRDPVWDDNLVMVENYEMTYKALFDHLTANGMSVTEFEELFRHIGQNVSVTDSSNPATAFMAAGQYLGGVQIALTSVQKAGNVPVAQEPVVEPVASVPMGIGLSREAPNPAAALLFAHWYVTEGQRILVKEQFIEQSPDETDLQGVQLARLESGDLDAQRLEEWRVAYDNMLHGEENVLPQYVTE